MAERVRVREVDDDGGRRLLRIVRRGTGPVVTWRRSQMALLSAQGMDVPKIAEVTFTSADRVRDLIHHFDADGEVTPELGEPEVVFCLAEFGPLNLQPHPGRQWAERGGERKDPDREPRPHRGATYTRPHGVRHLFAAYDLGKDQLHGHIKPRKHRTRFLEFCRYLRSLHPPQTRIAIALDSFPPHLSTKKDVRVGDRAKASNVELAYTPTNSSWLNRIEARFTALRYFALDGTDHPTHKAQGSMIRRYVSWRNGHAADKRLRTVINRASVA
ncbi:transposase [Streptomyces wedmorensis]|uniref:Transposase n=1 Tax=Streptomyces wedmorensis TaxID=43759 RepID=A0ABW6J817_STRWE